MHCLLSRLVSWGVRRIHAAAWTPDLALYRHVLGSKWMFTADLLIFAATGTEQAGEAPPIFGRSHLGLKP
jgi:hypothetical protein